MCVRVCVCACVWSIYCHMLQPERHKKKEEKRREEKKKEEKRREEKGREAKRRRGEKRREEEVKERAYRALSILSPHPHHLLILILTILDGLPLDAVLTMIL